MRLDKIFQLLFLIMLIPAIGFWADGIAMIVQDPRGFWECFTLVLGLFKEML